MITLPPKLVVNDAGPANCFPDNAPPPSGYIAVHFDGVNYVFFQKGDTVPAADL